MQIKSIVLATAIAAVAGTAGATVTLNGRDLTQAEARRVAAGEEVAIAPEAMKWLADSHNLVMTAARNGIEIYGLTVGVGLNKDHKLFDAKGLN